MNLQASQSSQSTMQRLVHLSKSACLQHTAWRVSRPQPLICRHALLTPRLSAPDRQHHRCMASFGGGGQDKRGNEPTLGEIGTELVSKVKQLPGAIYNGLANLANKFLPGRQQTHQEPPRQQRSPVRAMTEGLFGGGIMGKIMENTLGRAVENLAKTAAEQLLVTQQISEKVQQKAAQAIVSNRQLQEYFGGSMQVAEPTSTDISMQSLNGQMGQTVKLVMPVVGANGRVAHAQVQSKGEGQMDIDIQVQLPGGRLIRIDPNDTYDDDQDGEEYSQQGRVIDVDWREVR